MGVERGRPNAVLLSDGRVLVTGDRSLDLRAVTGKAETYDPDAGTWSSTEDMSKASIGHTLTLLPTAECSPPAVCTHKYPSRRLLHDRDFRSFYKLVVARPRTLRASRLPLRDPPARRESPPDRGLRTRRRGILPHLDGVRHAVAIGPAMWHTIPLHRPDPSGAAESLH